MIWYMCSTIFTSNFWPISHHSRLNLAMESKVPLTPVRSRTWHATTEKVPIPTVKRPATTLGITHPPAVTSTAVIRRPVTRPKTTAGT